MIINSSAINMNSARGFARARRSTSALSTWGNAGSTNTGHFIQTAVSTARRAVNKDPDGKQNKQNPSDSMDGLMARFSQSRSIRAASLESSRNMQSLHIIRRQSIGYLLHQLFWGGSRTVDPMAALFTDYSNNTLGSLQSFGGQLKYGYAYAEAEETTFSTEGKVVTASGKEINFNLDLTMSRSFYEEASTIVDFGAAKLTDPLVINLDTEVASVSDQKFYFDLDADGHQEEISRLNAGSGFLALDKNGDGVINDGSELFGAATGNGFIELAQYDQDGNGWIDEADEIFDKLLIWQKDEDGNDVLRGLGAAGVGAIYLGSTNTDFSLNSAEDNHTNAVIRQTGVFLYENGNTGTVQQVDFAQ